MTFQQLLDVKYFSLMVLFSYLAIYCISYFSPSCPSTCPRLVLDFCNTFKAALILQNVQLLEQGSIVVLTRFQGTSNLSTFISVP